MVDSEQCGVEISHTLAALANLDAEVDISSAWGTIRENTEISSKDILGYCKLKKHNLWLDEGCSKLLDQGK
jgi:hypothetical protein